LGLNARSRVQEISVEKRNMKKEERKRKRERSSRIWANDQIPAFSGNFSLETVLLPIFPM